MYEPKISWTFLNKFALELFANVLQQHFEYGYQCHVLTPIKCQPHWNENQETTENKTHTKIDAYIFFQGTCLMRKSCQHVSRIVIQQVLWAIPLLLKVRVVFALIFMSPIFAAIRSRCSVSFSFFCSTTHAILGELKVIIMFRIFGEHRCSNIEMLVNIKPIYL